MAVEVAVFVVVGGGGALPGFVAFGGDQLVVFVGCVWGKVVIVFVILVWPFCWVEGGDAVVIQETRFEGHDGVAAVAQW